ncbi:MAG: hypothetical protein DRP65_10210 [Planctomycetota bacterium]|nr:MAG: hypothetical protein DRP65_10210 [Planctomycetota bacterium]
MKRITFKAWKEDGVYKANGYLFTYAGLRLVVKRHNRLTESWHVFEYSTGRGIPGTMSCMRKEAVAKAKQGIDYCGSLTLCKVLDAVICSGTGILNV